MCVWFVVSTYCLLQWCGHCKTLAPTWIELEIQASNHLKNLKIARVDCTSPTAAIICKKYKVMHSQKLQPLQTLRYITPRNTQQHTQQHTLQHTLQYILQHTLQHTLQRTLHHTTITQTYKVIFEAVGVRDIFSHTLQHALQHMQHILKRTPQHHQNTYLNIRL